MAFIKTIAPAMAQGEVLEMYERQQAAWGYVPNYAKVFSGRPEVLARWGRLLAEIKRPMSRRRFELVTFAAAIELRNTACSLAHGKAVVKGVSLLGHEGELEWSQSAAGLQVTLPPVRPCDYAYSLRVRTGDTP